MTFWHDNEEGYGLRRYSAFEFVGPFYFNGKLKLNGGWVVWKYGKSQRFYYPHADFAAIYGPSVRKTGVD